MKKQKKTKNKKKQKTKKKKNTQKKTLFTKFLPIGTKVIALQKCIELSSRNKNLEST